MAEASTDPAPLLGILEGPRFLTELQALFLCAPGYSPARGVMAGAHVQQPLEFPVNQTNLMTKVEIYTTPTCPYCHRAKALLDVKGVEYVEYSVSHDREKAREMVVRSQRRTVPQIFIDGTSVGGSDDLALLESSGELDRRLATFCSAAYIC